jgi:hypothetical protein
VSSHATSSLVKGFFEEALVGIDSVSSVEVVESEVVLKWRRPSRAVGVCHSPDYNLRTMVDFQEGNAHFDVPRREEPIAPAVHYYIERCKTVACLQVPRSLYMSLLLLQSAPSNRDCHQT